MTVFERCEEKFQEFATERVGGCRLWTGELNSKGYGVIRLWVDGRYQRFMAHRFAWEREHGPVPVGLNVLHTCDTHRCVEEGHLFAGTQKENMEDMVAKERQARGEANAKAKLTEDDVRKIRAMLDRGCTGTDIARTYGVAHGQIYAIESGRAWSHVS